jgi:hypothetical protein
VSCFLPAAFSFFSLQETCWPSSSLPTQLGFKALGMCALLLSACKAASVMLLNKLLLLLLLLALLLLLVLLLPPHSATRLPGRQFPVNRILISRHVCTVVRVQGNQCRVA